MNEYQKKVQSLISQIQEDKDGEPFHKAQAIRNLESAIDFLGSMVKHKNREDGFQESTETL